MKKLLILVLAVLAVYNITRANVLIVNNNANAPTGHYYSIQDAMNVGASGDTIYVIGSPNNYGSIYLSKTFIFIGAGYRPDKDFNYSSKIDDINGANIFGYGNNTKVFGFEIFGRVGKDNVSCCGGAGWEVAYNKFTGSNAVIFPGDNSNIHDNYFEIPTNGAIYGTIQLAGYNSCQIHNNIFSRLTGNNGVLITLASPFNPTGNQIYNNCFLSASGGNVFGSLNSSTIANNIFYGYSIADTNSIRPSNCAFNNNLTNYSFNPFGNNTFNSFNYFGLLQLSQFQNVNPTLNGAFDFPPYYYNLIASSIGHHAGTDATDIGAFGGSNPFSNYTGMNSGMPQVKKFDLANPIVGQGDSLKFHAIGYANAGDSIIAAAYFFDTDTAGTSIPIPLTPLIGFDFNYSLNHDSLPIGNHKIGIRFMNSHGIWSFPEIRSFSICYISGALANFDLYQSGRDVIFQNNSTDQQNCIWQFGDGNYSVSIQRQIVHHYDTAGIFTACLTSNNTCPSQSILCKQLAIKGINSITPNRGGNSGLVTCYIQGGGFKHNAIAKLSKAGHSDIYAIDSLSSMLNEQLYLATFNLMNADTGKWNVFVVVPNDTTLALLNRFTIEYPTADSIQIEFQVPPFVRKGSQFPIQIKYSNLSNVNVNSPYFSLISLDSVPLAFQKNQLTNNYRQLPLFLANKEFNSQFLYNDTGNISNLNFLSPGTNNTITIWARASNNSTSKFALVNNDVPNSNNSGGWDGNCSVVPDLNFSTPCLNHDNCYGTCGSDKLECDLAFFRDMLQTCEASYPSHNDEWSRCIVNAAHYYQGVRLFGYAFWAIAQLNCTPNNPPPNPPLGTPNNNGCPINASCANTNNVASLDPNYKIGSLILERSIYHASRKHLNYSIYFENSDTATANAQTVLITDTLETTNLDLSTLQIQQLGFADTILLVPPGRKSFTANVDLRPGVPLIAQIVAYLDESNGVFITKIESLDPLTMQPTTNPLLGFLPPNDLTGKGEGFVSYSIKPKENTPTGTIIRNKADIYFDNNSPVRTPTWTNIIDDLKPQSHVNILPATTTSDSIIVSWTGIDNGPAGVYAYNIYFNINGGQWHLWKYSTSLTTDTFVGLQDSTYGFYSVAIDSALNIEAAPQIADATTTIIGSILPTGLVFTGKTLGSRAILQWQDRAANNVSYYAIERSEGDNRFVPIGKVKASYGKSEYSFADENFGSYAANAGKACYRLQQVSLDGAINYSKIVCLTTSNDLQISITPNPAKGKLTVNFSHRIRGIVTFNWYSSNGQLMQSMQSKNIANQVLNIQGLSAGIYSLKINAEDKVYNMKVVVER